MSLRETLQDIYASSDHQVAEAQLQWWCGWATRSRLCPFRHLAMTVRQQWSSLRNRLSPARMVFEGNA
jgi:Transposase